MSKLDPGMSRDQVIEAAKGKLEEARFFISKMHETETRQHLGADERQFGWFLSAFLSAARSAPQVISALEYSLKGKDKDWIWINEVRNGWDDSQRELYREMT